MTRPTLSALALLAIAILLFVSAHSLLASPMGDRARAAVDEYQPVDEARLAAARNRLSEAALRLEAFLRPGSEKGERWKRYLKWDGVQQQLKPDASFNGGPLLATLAQFRRNENGLELAPFKNAADAIENYTNIAAVAGVGDQKKYVEGQLTQLAKYLDRHAETPTPRSRYEIERRLYLLENIGALPNFIRSVRQELARPNTFVEVNEAVLARLVAEPVSDVGPVTDCILGTNISGTGYTSGTVRAETRPSDDGAMIVFVIEGTTHSDTVGYNGPVVIRSDGTTHFTATKQVKFTDETFWNYPATSSAKTSTTTRSVKKKGGGLGSRIIEGIAKQRVAEQKGQANAIAADHAEVRIANSLDEDLLPRLRTARKNYEQEFQKPLARVNSKPNLLHFSSTSDHLLATARVNSTGELAADSPAPSAGESGDVVAKLHESAPANFLSAWIGGATLSQQTVDESPSLDVTLPDWLEEAIDEARAERDEDRLPEDPNEFQPWSIRFRRQRPVSFAFGDNAVTATIHAARIQAGSDSYDNWDVSAKYQMHTQNGQLILIREGEIEVIPSAFDPADGGRLTNRQVALRGNLAKEINRLSENGRGFPESTEIGPIDLSEESDKLNILSFNQLTSAGGWLSAVMSVR